MARAYKKIKSDNRVLNVSKDKKTGVTRVDVKSSFIDYVSHAAREQLLVVKIRDTCYAYGSVTRERFKKIVLSASIGKAYNEFIKSEDKIELVSSWKE